MQEPREAVSIMLSEEIYYLVDGEWQKNNLFVRGKNYITAITATYNGYLIERRPPHQDIWVSPDLVMSCQLEDEEVRQ